MISQITLIIN